MPGCAFRHGGGAQAVADLGGGLAEGFRIGNRGLADDTERARLHRLHAAARALFGERGADHDRDWVLRHDLAQEGDAIHARHFEIKEDHVWEFIDHHAGGGESVGGEAHDGERRIGFDDAAHHDAGRGRVVHDQNTEGIAGCECHVSAFWKTVGTICAKPGSRTIMLSEWPTKR